ncbi:TonB-dependent receptor plug domain-containing protein [Mucilaginibacter sp. BT774]|uniref:TonB-dependent receptor plug domain-containing protein n=1 Tax=Mucilaginibacter sp. BT774 TaxID=3062276 RepID=UPI0026765493|nr:TonB-dependent receptor plug domain-containing protein [Mucilaginibacter sp. BT774]MDO3624841.1 TonB-dependent receptor plug domain-containing protein [Mucilaginibacter sp. BT774]
MKKILYTCVFLAAFCNLQAYCQDNSSVINNAVAGLKSLSGNHVIEKAYLHFDKPYYAVGDTMRFKAYLTLGEHYDLSRLSGILHVDLISPDNSIFRSIKLQIVNGIGWGDFPLPIALTAGNYRVRAYTNYMQNAPEYFFDKTIAIGSTLNTGMAPNTAESKEKDDLQFFPEGGELVGSMVSKVAFKAIGSNGLGINVKGVIVDNTNNQVASFTSSHLGMGTFYLQPEEGKMYKAKLTFADGAQGVFNLPAVQSKGIALALKDTLGKLSIEIHCNKAYFQENLNKNISLVIYGSGFVNTVSTKLDSRRLSMDIANTQFPSGVVRVTLFSQTGDPLSERLAFIKNSDMVDLTLTSNKTTYGKREKVLLNLAAKDKGNAAEGHFSVAVIDENQVPVDENNETTIQTYLLLTLPLRGYVEQPNYYFLQNAEHATADLDALLLTQGYRRFTWKKLMNERDSAFVYTPEKALEISGTAKTAAGTPVKDMDVMLLTADMKSNLGERTDNNGKFKFTNLPPIADSTVLILQATGSTRSKNATIFTVDSDKPGPAVAEKKETYLQTDANKAMPVYLSTKKPELGNELIKNAAYKYNAKSDTRPQKVLNESDKVYESSNLGGSGHADQVIKGDQIKNSPSLSQGLNGLLRGVYFINGVAYLQGNMVFNGTNQVAEPMYVVIDGYALPLDRGGIDNINPVSVETVELLKGSSASMYGVNGGAGVLVITSRKRQSTEGVSTRTLGSLSFQVRGFYVAREFYSPKYEVNTKINKPDLRSTIIWISELRTDKDGKAMFEYYNADGPGTYRVVAEGIDDKGNIGRTVYRYQVK